MTSLVKKCLMTVLVSALSLPALAVYPTVDANGNKTYEKEVDKNGVNWLVVDKRQGTRTYLNSDNIETLSNGAKTAWAKIKYSPAKDYGSVPVRVKETTSHLVFDCANNRYAPTNTVAYGVDGNAYASTKDLSLEQAVAQYSIPVKNDTLGAYILRAVCSI